MQKRILKPTHHSPGGSTGPGRSLISMIVLLLVTLLLIRTFLHENTVDKVVSICNPYGPFTTLRAVALRRQTLLVFY